MRGGGPSSTTRDRGRCPPSSAGEGGGVDRQKTVKKNAPVAAAGLNFQANSTLPPSLTATAEEAAHPVVESTCTSQQPVHRLRTRVWQKKLTRPGAAAAAAAATCWTALSPLVSCCCVTQPNHYLSNRLLTIPLNRFYCKTKILSLCRYGPLCKK